MIDTRVGYSNPRKSRQPNNSVCTFTPVTASRRSPSCSVKYSLGRYSSLSGLDSEAASPLSLITRPTQNNIHRDITATRTVLFMEGKTSEVYIQLWFGSMRAL